MSYTGELTLKSSGAVTANGQSEIADVTLFGPGLLLIDITAVSGTTPTIDFVVQTRIAGIWVALPNVTIAQKTTVTSFATALTNTGKEIRLSWTVGGTSPSFTFSSTYLGKDNSV